jgi:hypothetical protein
MHNRAKPKKIIEGFDAPLGLEEANWGRGCGRTTNSDSKRSDRVELSPTSAVGLELILYRPRNVYSNWDWLELCI